MRVSLALRSGFPVVSILRRNTTISTNFHNNNSSEFSNVAKTDQKTLKAGFTTGTAAAAAAKGALMLLLSNRRPSHVQVILLTGDTISIPVHTCNFAESGKKVACTVIKDAGDDPDVTHKAEIGAAVTIIKNEKEPVVQITGGKGVGRVTKPGLEIPPGEPAINKGPRKMITQAVTEVLAAHDQNVSVIVEVFVPEGEILAKKTLNSRLGILGGISILGTTGIVKPMSHDAYIATIKSAVSVARAMKLEEAVFTTGRRSEKYAQSLWQHLPEEAFIQIGDFFKASLESAADKGLKTVTLAVFFGKAVKMAQGVPHTHAAKSELTLHRLSEWAYEITKDRDFSQEIRSANTARHAFDLITGKYPAVIAHVGKQMIRSAGVFAGPEIKIRGVIFDYAGNVIFSEM
jgi:cobalt-precorrin-5B (C1)-methyltransferase